MNDESGNDLWTSDLAPAPAEPQTELEPPAAWPEEVAEAPSAEAPCAPLRRSRGWLWLLPAIIFAGGCTFLWLQNRAAAATVEALTTHAPQLLLPVGAPNPLAAQLDSVRKAAESQNFFSAARSAKALALPAGRQPAALPGASAGPAAAAGVPPAPAITPEITAFFKAHPDLEQRLTQYSDLARAARDAGKEVQPLRDLRDRLMQAAQQGDTMQVTALLDQFAQGLQALGVNPAQAAGGGDLDGLLAQFGQAFDRAQRAGRDPRRAVALIRQAQAAAQAGKREEALALARQATEALKSAPRAAGGVRMAGPRMMPAGPPPAVGQQILSAALNLMGIEDRDLAQTYEALGDASGALRENNEDQILEILGVARQNLERIRARRQAFSAQLQEVTAAAHPAGKTPARPAATQAQTPPPAPEPNDPVAKIAQLLDDARKMSADDYKQARMSLARGTLEILLSAGPTAPPASPTGKPLTAEQQRATLQVEARVREKLQLASGPYQDLKRSGKDVSALSARLEEARKALWAGRLFEAEENADQVLRTLGLLPARAPSPPPAH